MLFKEITFLIVWLSFTGLVGVFGDTDAVKSVSVLEGDSVTLNSGLTDIETVDRIVWQYGNARPVIAKISKEKKITVSDEILKNRLQLDNQTGSLTITDTRTTDSGEYEVAVSDRSTETKNKFTVTVYARLPVPVIINFSHGSSVSKYKCSVLCSVVNVGHVTLSWYKENSLLSSISVSDLSISLFLPLEVECLDDSSYSCVAAYSFTNQTTHLNNTQLCSTCPVQGSVTLIVLISAAAGSLLIVAAVRIFCFCKKHRKTEQEIQTVQTCTGEITYTDPTFYKRNTQRESPKPEDYAVYASVYNKR